MLDLDFQVLVMGVQSMVFAAIMDANYEGFGSVQFNGLRFEVSGTLSIDPPFSRVLSGSVSGTSMVPHQVTLEPVSRNRLGGNISSSEVVIDACASYELPIGSEERCLDDDAFSLGPAADFVSEDSVQLPPDIITLIQ